MADEVHFAFSKLSYTCIGSQKDVFFPEFGHSSVLLSSDQFVFFAF